MSLFISNSSLSPSHFISLTFSSHMSLSLSCPLSLFSMTMTRISRPVGSLCTHGPDLHTCWTPWLVHLFGECSHHARNTCLGILVQASYHLERSGPASVLERIMCLVWCGVRLLFCCCCVGCAVVLDVCCCVVDCRQTLRHHSATNKRVMVALARLLTLGAPRRKITLREKQLRPSQKTETRKARCPRAISNLSSIVKNTTRVGREVFQCWRRCLGCCVVKKDVTSMTVPKNIPAIIHKLHRWGFISHYGSS